MDLDCFCFAGASHTFGVVEDINHIRLGMPEGSRYINAGILMMNLDELRRSYTSKELFDYIDKNADNLPLGRPGCYKRALLHQNALCLAGDI